MNSPLSKPVEHLRAILVATKTLPAPDEHLVRVERWITATITGHPQARSCTATPSGTCHARLRARNNKRPATHGQASAVQQQVRAAIALLDWLAAHHLNLQGARQGDLDDWLTDDQATGHSTAGNFVRWAKHHKLTDLDLAAVTPSASTPSKLHNSPSPLYSPLFSTQVHVTYTL